MSRKSSCAAASGAGLAPPRKRGLARLVLAADEHHRVGDDLDLASLGAVLRLPATLVETAVDGDLTALC